MSKSTANALLQQLVTELTKLWRGGGRMKVLKYRNCKRQYKEVCCNCRSKLLVDYSDIYWQPRYLDGSHVFDCPVCGTCQILNARNEALRHNYASRVKRKQED